MTNILISNISNELSLDDLFDLLEKYDPNLLFSKRKKFPDSDYWEITLTTNEKASSKCLKLLNRDIGGRIVKAEVVCTEKKSNTEHNTTTTPPSPSRSSSSCLQCKENDINIINMKVQHQLELIEKENWLIKREESLLFETETYKVEIEHLREQMREEEKEVIKEWAKRAMIEMKTRVYRQYQKEIEGVEGVEFEKRLDNVNEILSSLQLPNCGEGDFLQTSNKVDTLERKFECLELVPLDKNRQIQIEKEAKNLKDTIGSIDQSKIKSKLKKRRDKIRETISNIESKIEKVQKKVKKSPDEKIL